MIWRLICLFRGHASPYLERRKRHGVHVMHSVCLRCRRAWPTVNRTAAEHRQAVKVSRPSARMVRPKNVEPLRRAR